MASACVLCGSVTNLSDEHVIPAALGGNLLLPEGTCRDCNNSCSSQFEAEFIKDLTVVRHALGIRNREGSIPAAAVTFDYGDIPIKGKLLPDGRLQGSDTVVPGATPDLTKYFMFSRRGARHLEGHAEAQGKRLVPLPADEYPPEVYPRTSMPLNFIAGLSARRTVAKIAYAYASLKLGRALTGGDRYQEIRSFIRTGVHSSRVRLFHSSQFNEATSLTAAHHAIILSNDSERRAATALVVLFGGLTYIVQLAEGVTVDAGATYLWNAKDKTNVGYFVKDHLHEHAGVDLVLQDQTKFDDIEAVASAWMPMLEQAAQERVPRRAPLE